ncbi:MAG: methyltransferase domain-containing protein [Magnetococcales bacterium]|nr:methyltransferase domain-containing protein [Magnetococcales bacterium]
MANSITQQIINFGEKAWGVLSLVMPKPFMDWLGITVAKLLFTYTDCSLADEEKKLNKAIPPAPLRYRVWGDPDIGTFMWSSNHCRKDIDRELDKLGVNWDTFYNILDFGCGSGRIFISLPDTIEDKYIGVDTDSQAISWCTENYPQARFQINPANPPMDFADSSFDLILAIAVFRHLDEKNQFSWLQELQRVTKKGGLLFISLHGEFCWQDFAPVETEVLKTNGFLFKQLTDPYQRSIFPEWYQATYHNQEYVKKYYDKYFEIVDYIPRGIEDETDLVICRKR